MEDYHIKTNNMEDLSTIANSKKHLDKKSKENTKIDDLQYIQNVND